MKETYKTDINLCSNPVTAPEAGEGREEENEMFDPLTKKPNFTKRECR